MINFIIHTFVDFVNSFFQTEFFESLSTNLDSFNSTVLGYSDEIRAILTDVSYFFPVGALIPLIILSFLLILVRIVLAVVNLIWW